MSLKSRKLIAGSVAFITATVALFIDKAQFAEWSTFTQTVFGLYILGNVGEHFAVKGGKRGEEKE